jgi:hypothetical protein
MRMEIHIKRDMINVSLIRELTRITWNISEQDRKRERNE